MKGDKMKEDGKSRDREGKIIYRCRERERKKAIERERMNKRERK